MPKSNAKRTRNCPLRPTILLAILTPVSLSLGSHNGASVASDPGISLDRKARAEAAALKAASNAATLGFKPSLEMKENADFLLMPALVVQEAMSDGKGTTVRFNAVMELNAPLCRTYVVLFERYWVSRDSYRVAVVWAEPHAGSLNFPIYPPTLNVVSDPNQFVISHQLQHMYDGTFPKPLGERGPFKHKFNTYYASDIRFAERETLDLRVRLSAIRPLLDPNGDSGERVLDMLYPQSTAPRKDDLAKMTVRAIGSRGDEVSLLDSDGQLLKSVQYEYAGQGDAKRLKRQTMFLPERPITVAFGGEGPTITIAGQKRRYPQLEIMDPPGGRKCIVDYQAVELGGCAVDLPSRIEVYTGDGRQLLRCARLSNWAPCDLSGEQVGKSAEQFSLFDPNESRCRDLLLKYWLKRRSEMAKDDVEILERLRKHFAQRPSASTTAGELLKRVNMLLQVDWILDDPNRLDEDFREYTRLLRSNGLGRMVLFGGENVIETTIRWGQIDTADRLLPVWLDAAVSDNDMASILDFASASLAKGSLWTTAKLLEKALDRRAIPGDQRFIAQALRAIALSRVCKMVQDPDGIKNDLRVAQARWVLAGTSEAGLREELRASATAARKSFDTIDKPTRQHRTLKTQLDAIAYDLLIQNNIEEETSIGNL